jgi:hypothetical protein
MEAMDDRCPSLLVTCLLVCAGACTPHGVELELDDPLEPDQALVRDGIDLRDLDDSIEPLDSPAEAIDLESRKVEALKPSGEADACAAGRKDAETHIAGDVLMPEAFGYPAPCREEYERILQDRYGVTLNAVAGCVVNSWILDHARCYNETMEAEIARRYGRALLEQVAKDAGCN